ncbi:MAG TPA: thrombospondin type 3 repeat-containing protein, partial [Planctomycetota bacterium]|nr:thrombospondin type 3 repeat-containing protein [Planctomycetota bacterium]
MVDQSLEPCALAPWTPLRVAGVLAIALAGAVALADRSEGVSVLHAAVIGTADDLDGDGLPNLLEQRLGTDINLVDSDGDGVSDAEEVARHSDPTDPFSIPAPGSVAINLVPYIQGGATHLVTVIYAADGNFSNKPYSMGARIGETVRTAPLIYFNKNATYSSQQGKAAGSKVMV